MSSLSLIESHNSLSLPIIRSNYLRPESSLSNGTHIVTLETSSSISTTAFTTCFELVRDNMRDMYKRSEFGWSATKKKKEMRHPAMRFLLLRTKDTSIVSEENSDDAGSEQESWEDECSDGEKDDGKVVGFLSFMVTEEEDEEVVYTYELHLAENRRNLGLGKHLMEIVEDFGRAVGLPKAMLTCFCENVDGIRFYNRNGYEIDVISPTPKVRGGKLKQPGYYILSKTL